MLNFIFIKHKKKWMVVLKCKSCGNIHKDVFGSGFFCSRACANTRKKTSKIYAPSKCVLCGNEVLVNVHTNKNLVKCDVCKKESKKESKKQYSINTNTRKCLICGEIGYKNNNCPRPDICKKRQ